jgi:hypothetical protein
MVIYKILYLSIKNGDKTYDHKFIASNDKIISKSSNNIRNITTVCWSLPIVVVVVVEVVKALVWKCQIYICCAHKTLPDITGRHFRYGRSGVGGPAVVVYSPLPLFFPSTRSFLTGYIRAYKRRSSPGPLYHSFSPSDPNPSTIIYHRLNPRPLQPWHSLSFESLVYHSPPRIIGHKSNVKAPSFLLYPYNVSWPDIIYWPLVFLI